MEEELKNNFPPGSPALVVGMFVSPEWATSNKMSALSTINAKVVHLYDPASPPWLNEFALSSWVLVLAH